MKALTDILSPFAFSQAIGKVEDQALLYGLLSQHTLPDPCLLEARAHSLAPMVGMAKLQ